MLAVNQDGKFGGEGIEACSQVDEMPLWQAGWEGVDLHDWASVLARCLAGHDVYRQ